MPEFDLTGAVAIVTGGNGGLGRDIALGLGRAGASVVIAARTSDRTESVVDELRGFGARALGVQCDVTSTGDIQRAIEATLAEFGSLSVLVNNAAIAQSGPWLSEEDWDGVFATNLRGPFLFTRYAYRALKRSGRGKVINIASGAAIVAWPTSPAYGASKAGLLHLTKTFAVAWAKDGIQVNAILPGAFRTPMNPMEAPGAVQRWEERTPAARLGAPGEIAGLAVFLASRASDYVTGESITIDGGVTLPRVARVD